MAPRRSNHTLTVVSPTVAAVERARSDLARGVHPRTPYDRIREENAARKKLEKAEKKKAKRTVTAPKIKMISPAEAALKQARSDIKRGSKQMGVLDVALEKDAERKKRSLARKARRAKFSEKQRMLSWL